MILYTRNYVCVLPTLYFYIDFLYLTFSLFAIYLTKYSFVYIYIEKYYSLRPNFVYPYSVLVRLKFVYPFPFMKISLLLYSLSLVLYFLFLLLYPFMKIFLLLYSLFLLLYTLFLLLY